MDEVEALWPQLFRYGISIAGTVLTTRGVMEASEWEVIAGALTAIAPIIYRIVTTMRKRNA